VTCARVQAEERLTAWAVAMNRIVANSLCNGGISEDNEVKQHDVGLTFSKDMSKDRTAFYEEEAVI